MIAGIDVMTPCNHANSVFHQKADFKGHVFESFADFSNAEFQGEVDFSGAVFKDGASFANATFICFGKDVSFENAVFLDSENHVNFSGAQFGRPWQRDFGEWRIGFQLKDGQYNLLRFKSAETDPATHEILENIPPLEEKNMIAFVQPWGMERHADEIAESFRIFRANPKSVSFSNCRFGDNASPAPSEEETKKTEVLKGNINFINSQFFNQGHVDFNSATFSNAGGVAFNSATFKQKGELGFRNIIWMQSGEADFRNMIFEETLNIKFDECLFICGGDIDFRDTRFPEKGSLMFQRCYFSVPDKNGKVDFTGTFFRHTIFEGGPISWLSGETDKERKPQAILKDRLQKNYETLPEKVSQRIEAIEAPIPQFPKVFDDNTLVLWQDLTSESAKNLTFLNTAFNKSLFNGMTLSHIQLNASHWQKVGERRILHDEKILKEDASETELRDIQDQYTQLKNNLESKGGDQQAGYFHHGEQEIRQKIRLLNKSPSDLGLWCLGVIYKRTSGYGEEPVRAIEVTISFILILMFFNCGTTGFITFPENTLVEFGPWLFKTFVQTISPFSWKSILAENAITSANVWRYSVFFIGQLLLLAIQIPLTVMTVRRHFKR